jgi:hypothetical protein
MPERAAPARTEHASAASRGGLTLDECAAVLGVSRERIRQIEASALRKCRRWCEARGLDPWLLLDLSRPIPSRAPLQSRTEGA